MKKRMELCQQNTRDGWWSVTQLKRERGWTDKAIEMLMRKADRFWGPDLDRRPATGRLYHSMRVILMECTPEWQWLTERKRARMRAEGRLCHNDLWCPRDEE